MMSHLYFKGKAPNLYFIRRHEDGIHVAWNNSNLCCTLCHVNSVVMAIEVELYSPLYGKDLVLT